VAASTYGYTWTLANVVNALNKIQQLWRRQELHWPAPCPAMAYWTGPSKRTLYSIKMLTNCAKLSLKLLLDLLEMLHVVGVPKSLDQWIHLNTITDTTWQNIFVDRRDKYFILITKCINEWFSFIYLIGELTETGVHCTVTAKTKISCYMRVTAHPFSFGSQETKINAVY
jgi:hypothetical protein